MSRGHPAAWIGLGAGAAATALAAVLLDRALREIQEIDWYAADIATTSEAIHSHTALGGALGPLGQLVARIRAAAAPAPPEATAA